LGSALLGSTARMNPVERVIRRVDAAQQRHRVSAFIFGVIKKYGGIAWTALLAAGAYIVHHDLRTASVYGIFATVLVLLAWIYLVVQVTVYAAEVNVVLTRRLWPRTIVQPPLAEADRASMALQALQNQRREEQSVRVSFTDRPAGVPLPAQTPRTPEEVTPPGRATERGDGAG
jgi:hypothetical protein